MKTILPEIVPKKILAQDKTENGTVLLIQLGNKANPFWNRTDGKLKDTLTIPVFYPLILPGEQSASSQKMPDGSIIKSEEKIKEIIAPGTIKKHGTVLIEKVLYTEKAIQKVKLKEEKQYFFARSTKIYEGFTKDENIKIEKEKNTHTMEYEIKQVWDGKEWIPLI